MDTGKRRILMNAFFKAQFSYGPLMWMCQSHKNNKRINKLYESCLGIICNDTLSCFGQFLDNDPSVSTHHLNLKSACKIMKSMSTPLINDLFKIKRDTCYNFNR